jgi:hypothetical protein
MRGGVHRIGGGQMMYLFDDLGSHFQNLTTPPHVSGVSTVSLLQWEYTVIFCGFSLHV